MKSEAVGQPPIDCESDPCYQTQPWVNHVKSYTYGPQPACSNCWVEIHYKTRDNSQNPNCQSLPPVEYQMDYIVVSGDCYFSPCNYYPPFDMKKAYQEAMASLLDELGYSPVLPDSCGPIFEHFTILSCFRQDFDLDGNKILRICNSYTCCIQDFQLCYKNGKLTISSLNRESDGDCANDPNYPDECMTICNWIDEALVPKRVLEDKHKSEINPLTVFPNPVSQDYITFNFSIDVSIESVTLLTNDGKLAPIEANQIVNGNKISIENFSNGYYMLILKDSNGRNYYSQFIIQR